MANVKAFILIDGSNFYFKVKSLGFRNQLNFDYGKFKQLIARNNTIIDSRYYIGKVRTDGSEKSRKMLSAQQSLLYRLKKSGFRYTFGYLLKNEGKFHEKGVDVQMAVDMLVGAYEKKCDRVILVSSDTDLQPAIKAVRAKNVMVEYVGFSHQPSVGMVSFCSESRLLTKEDIASCFGDKP